MLNIVLARCLFFIIFIGIVVAVYNGKTKIALSLSVIIVLLIIIGVIFPELVRKY